jgi:hypothetical protein
MSCVYYCLRLPVALELSSLGGRGMHNFKLPIFAYVVAAAFILAVAFHSPTKTMIAAQDQTTTITTDEK